MEAPQVALSLPEVVLSRGLTRKSGIGQTQIELLVTTKRMSIARGSLAVLIETPDRMEI